MRDEDTTKIAIYFNEEYIGEALSFKFKKGSKNFMPQLEIIGNYQGGIR